MTPNPRLPEGSELVRTTPEFDQHTVPAGLLAAHTTGTGVWGRLVVHHGSATFTFEDQPGSPHRLHRGDMIVIAPQRPHRVTVTGPVRFVIEFHRAPTDPAKNPHTPGSCRDTRALPEPERIDAS